MRVLNLSAFALLLAGATVSLSLEAATFTLAPSADARIIDIGPGFENSNFGSDILSVYTAQGNVQRTFMPFDLSPVSLASTQRIAQATLALRASTAFGGNTGQPMEVYRVLEPWVENTVTWLQRDTGKLWTNPGGDFTGTGGRPFSSSTASPSDGQTVDWDITELVDEWLEKVVPNYGLLLLSYIGNGLTFVQNESPLTNSRPVLTVTTTNGVPRLKVAYDALQSKLLLSWRGIGTAILQERPNLSAASAWVDSSLTVTSQNGVSQASVTATGGRFYRLRSNP